MSTRWHYKVEEVGTDTWGRLKPDTLEERLRQMGGQGWELVQVVRTQSSGPALLFFKRPA